MWDHKIDIKEGFEPKSFKDYNLTPEEQKELDKFLDENLEKGYIWWSQSPMASPFFFVKKEDGKLRPCQDYQYLNDWTIKNDYPLPLISEIISKLKGQSIFQNLTYDGAITMFESNLGINGKWHSKQTKDYMNQQLCSLECAIHQPLFRWWWMKYSKRKLKAI